MVPPGNDFISRATPTHPSIDRLLVLTERKTRWEIVRKMRDKSMKSVIQTFDEILRNGAYSKEDFKTITSDNGSEFMNADHFEGLGIRYFYAHSFCSCERGSKENNNPLIWRPSIVNLQWRLCIHVRN